MAYECETKNGGAVGRVPDRFTPLMTAPSWADAISAISSALTFLAIAAGGAIGYTRYVKGRILHPGCETHIAGQIANVIGTQTLHIQASVTNSGTVQLAFASTGSVILRVEGIDQPMWDDARKNGGDVLWSEGLFFARDLTIVEGRKVKDLVLEPNERFSKHVLIPLYPSFQQGPFRVTLTTSAHPKSLFRRQAAQHWASEIVIHGADVNG